MRIIIILLSLTMLGCSKETVVRKNIHQKVFNRSAIAHIEKNIDIPEIDSSNERREIRIWFSFSDQKLPVPMQMARIVEKNDAIEFRNYIFFSVDTTYLKDISDLTRKNFRYKIFESKLMKSDTACQIIMSQSITSVENINFTAIDSIAQFMFSVMTPSYGLIEEKKEQKVTSIYMIEPPSFAHVSDNLNSIAILYKMADLQLRRDSKKYNIIYDIYHTILRKSNTYNSTSL